MSTIRLGPSRLAAYESCPRAYAWKYVWRFDPAQTSCSLVFGAAAHQAIESSFVASAYGRPCDPVQVFTDKWKSATASTTVSYSSSWTEAELLHTGQVLMSRFETAFSETGLSVAFDNQAKPLVERALEAVIGKGITASVKLDLAAFTDDDTFLVIDAKTPVRASDEGFSSVSDQGTFYQLVLDAHAKRLGIPEVQGFAYFEGIKRKVPKTDRGEGPVWHLSDIGKRRSEGEISEFLGKLNWVAEAIRSQRFPKQSRMGFDSPCALCEYRDACWYNDLTGLKKRESRNSTQSARTVPSVHSG